MSTDLNQPILERPATRADLARQLVRSRGQRVRVVGVTAPGRAARDMRGDALLASKHTTIDGPTYEEWLESADAHMHVGWSAVFTVPDGQPRPTLAALRDRVDRRLDDLEWCRWRLQRAP